MQSLAREVAEIEAAKKEKASPTDRPALALIELATPIFLAYAPSEKGAIGDEKLALLDPRDSTGKRSGQLEGGLRIAKLNQLCGMVNYFRDPYFVAEGIRTSESVADLFDRESIETLADVTRLYERVTNAGRARAAKRAKKAAEKAAEKAEAEAEEAERALLTDVERMGRDAMAIWGSDAPEVLREIALSLEADLQTCADAGIEVPAGALK
jgi:hypothetical protein